MSETLGAFLIAITVLLWPAPGRPLGALPAFALGALAVGTSLVTPAAAFVALPVLGVLAWRNRRSCRCRGADGGRYVSGPRPLADVPAREDRPRGAAASPPHRIRKSGAPDVAPDLVHDAPGQVGLVEPGGAARASRAGPRAGIRSGLSSGKALEEAPSSYAAIRHRQRLRRDVPRRGARPENRASGPFLDRPSARSVRDALAGLPFDDRRAGVPPASRRSPPDLVLGHPPRLLEREPRDARALRLGGRPGLPVEGRAPPRASSPGPWRIPSRARPPPGASSGET